LMEPRETALEVAASHPAFEGHFPGHPILPGVVLIAEAIAAIEAATARPAPHWTLQQAKFLAPVEPGARLTIVQAPLASGAVRFEIRDGERTVATGTLSPRLE
jgi:3-hydroxyacyl-[acyl-carrier-protein] dehydratase